MAQAIPWEIPNIGAWNVPRACQFRNCMHYSEHWFTSSVLLQKDSFFTGQSFFFAIILCTLLSSMDFQMMMFICVGK